MTVPTTLVAIAVVPHEGRYLIVEERDGTFYLPAGRVERGESVVAAVVRETREETGVAVVPEGLLYIDHWHREGHDKLRFVFVARVSGPVVPKSRDDEHSRGAAFRTRDELRTLPLRDGEVLHLIERYEASTSLLPCAAYEWFGPKY